MIRSFLLSCTQFWTGCSMVWLQEPQIKSEKQRRRLKLFWKRSNCVLKTWVPFYSQQSTQRWEGGRENLRFVFFSFGTIKNSIAKRTQNTTNPAETTHHEWRSRNNARIFALTMNKIFLRISKIWRRRRRLIATTASIFGFVNHLEPNSVSHVQGEAA